MTDLEKISGVVRKEIQEFNKVYALQFQASEKYLKPFFKLVGLKKGKQLRPLLFFLSQGLVDRSHLEDVKIAVVLELLHTATLVHDDVIDGANQRRGTKTVNALWGDRVSVLFGDYLFARVLCLGVETGSLEILKTISDIVLAMGSGELRQIVQSNRKMGNLTSYYRIIKEKTAGLFSAACKLGGLSVSASDNELDKLFRFGENFGMAFQIRDDILDLLGDSRKTGKPSTLDLMNNHYSLPVLFAYHRASSGEKKELNDKLKIAEPETGKL